MGLSVSALAETIEGPKDIGFMLAEKLYPYDKTASGEGWSYDGNYTLTFSGINDTKCKFQFYNPKKDVNIVVKDGTENNIGSLYVVYRNLNETNVKTFNFSGSGTLTCKSFNLQKAPITVKDVTIDAPGGVTVQGLTMTSGNIKATELNIECFAKSLVGKFSVTGGTIEFKNDENKDKYIPVLQVGGKEDDLVSQIISQFKDSLGNPLQTDIHEGYSTGNTRNYYYGYAKGSGADGYAHYAIFGGAAPSTPAQPAAGTFTDVVPDSYYADPVKRAVEKGITNGTSETTFSPEAPCTREMAVEFMWKHAGSPSEASASSFTDVSSAAVNWAVEKGITNGTSETTFSPELTCTRAQIVTFLWRAFGK